MMRIEEHRLHALTDHRRALQERICRLREDPGVQGDPSLHVALSELERLELALDRQRSGLGNVCTTCGGMIGAARHALMLDETECAWCASLGHRHPARAS